MSFELKRPRCRRGVLFLALASAAFAQTESQIESDEVKRVGSHLNCQCGGCNDNLNCMMSAGQCPYCKPSRKKIFKMQLGGMDDSSIVASFVQEVGYKVLRRDPSSLFWLVPYFSLGLGALLVAFNLMRMRSRVNSQALTRASAGGPSGPHDERLQFYLDTIEKIQPE